MKKLLTLLLISMTSFLSFADEGLQTELDSKIQKQIDKTGRYTVFYILHTEEGPDKCLTIYKNVTEVNKNRYKTTETTYFDNCPDASASESVDEGEYENFDLNSYYGDIVKVDDNRYSITDLDSNFEAIFVFGPQNEDLVIDELKMKVDQLDRMLHVF